MTAKYIPHTPAPFKEVKFRQLIDCNPSTVSKSGWSYHASPVADKKEMQRERATIIIARLLIQEV